MNIFIFDTDHLTNARLHPDALVNKIRLECCQMLGSVAHRYGFIPPLNDKGKPYGRGYFNHPCTRWTGDTRSNYLWVCDYLQALILEAEHRGYSPKYQDKLDHCYSNAHLVPNGGLTPVPLAMARTNPFKSNQRDEQFWYNCFLNDNVISRDEYRVACSTRHSPLDVAVKFYRGYLMYAKCHYAAWRHTEIPSFWSRQTDSGKLYCSIKR